MRVMVGCMRSGWKGDGPAMTGKNAVCGIYRSDSRSDGLRNGSKCLEVPYMQFDVTEERGILVNRCPILL
jgi:hypothetical protein